MWNFYFYSTESHFDVVMKASEIFQSLPLGKLLSDVEGTYILEVLKCYIRDFVYMIHPVQTNSECQVKYLILKHLLGAS